MAESAWTTYHIGGEIKSPDAFSKLIDLLAAFVAGVAPDREAVMDTIVAKQSLNVEGFLKNASHTDLDAFLEDSAMPFSANWPSCSAFNAGLRFWLPGMAAPQDRAADDSGNPMVDLPTLKVAQQEGRTIDEVIGYLQAAIVIPPLTAAAGAFDQGSGR